MPETPRTAVRFDTATPAVVLKFDPNVLHHGGLGVIRGLARFGIPVHCVCEAALAPAAHSRHLRGRWLWRVPTGDVERTLAGLHELADRIGRRAVLFPTDDAAAIFLAEHGNGLRQRYLFPDPPSHLPRRVAAKSSLHELCRQWSVPCPRTVLARDWGHARRFGDDVGYPVVCKLAEPWKARPEARIPSSSVVRSREQLRERYEACRQRGIGLLLQEFVPTDAGGDWFFHGYCDASSRCLPACTGVKERSYPPHAGLTSAGRSADNPELRRQATGLLARLGFRGIVDLDYRTDRRDGQYKLLDFNPRLGAQFRLFRDDAGGDVALAAYLDLTGQTPATGTGPVAVPGRRFVVENYDPIAALRGWRRGELGAGSWLRSLRGVDETAWFSRDDPVPFVLMCFWMLWRLLSRFPGSSSPRRFGPFPRRRMLLPDSARIDGRALPASAPDRRYQHFSPEEDRA